MSQQQLKSQICTLKALNVAEHLWGVLYWCEPETWDTSWCFGVFPPFMCYLSIHVKPVIHIKRTWVQCSNIRLSVKDTRVILWRTVPLKKSFIREEVVYLWLLVRRWWERKKKVKIQEGRRDWSFLCSRKDHSHWEGHGYNNSSNNRSSAVRQRPTLSRVTHLSKMHVRRWNWQNDRSVIKQTYTQIHFK